MELIVHQDIYELYPDLSLGILLISNCDNKKSQETADLLRQQEQATQERDDIEPVKQHPNIDAWRQAHKAFGNSPNRYAPSVEAVVKRVVKGGNLPDINPLVNLYNYISLKYIVPVGGEDLQACQGNIHLSKATGDEQFIGLGDTELDPPQPGEVVYKDDLGVLCRRFNWREADRTKLTEQTTDAMIVIEGLPPVTKEVIYHATDELRSLVKEHTHATVEAHVIDAQSEPVQLTSKQKQPVA